MPWLTTKKVLTVILALIGFAYPVLAYFGLSKFNPRIILICLLIAIILRAALFVASRRMRAAFITLFLATLIALVGWHSELHALRLYPVAISLTLAAIFGASLWFPPPVIERLARLRDPDLDAFGIRYTRALTKIWVAFFILNAAIATWTVWQGTLAQWTLYNGLISYLLIGALFFGEWPVRRLVRRRHEKSGASI